MVAIRRRGNAKNLRREVEVKRIREKDAATRTGRGIPKDTRDGHGYTILITTVVLTQFVPETHVFLGVR